MIMTLAEAILHLQDTLNNPKHNWYCDECKQEHEQLLQWLMELYALKDHILPSVINDLEPLAICSTYRSCENCPFIADKNGCKWKYHNNVLDILK